MKTNLLRTSVGWGILVVVAQSCGAEEKTGTTTSALSSSDRPQGLVCGLAYSLRMVQLPGVWPLVPDTWPADGTCQGQSTIKASPIRLKNGVGNPPATDYQFVYRGDNR